MPIFGLLILGEADAVVRWEIRIWTVSGDGPCSAVSARQSGSSAAGSLMLGRMGA